MKPLTLPRHWSAPKEALVIWALCFGTLLVAFLVARPYAKIVATLGFLYFPQLSMNRRNEDFTDYGVTLRAWKRDLKLFLVMVGLVGPPFVLGYWGYAELLTHLPETLARWLAPYTTAWSFKPALPPRFAEWVVDQVFVVALPEEFFYRGFVQTRLRDAWPQGRTFLGARLGPAFWLTAVLFALGHLAIFEFWRLGVFFPALLFGWMRERSGTVLGAAAFHAACNLGVQVLEASFYGPR